jgi:hypothetical protein
MFRNSPLSLFGWLALGAALGSAGLAVAAWLLPRVPDAICTRDAVHSLPSGGEGRLCEILTETQPFASEDWLVVRMVVPDLSSREAGRLRADHDWVCARIGLPAASGAAALPARIVVQLMAEPFPRGEPAPGISQSFEAYSIRDGACIWELL